MYYLKLGFQITILQVDGYFAPLQSLIQDIPGGHRVNLSSSSEHVTEIGRRIQEAKEKDQVYKTQFTFQQGT